MKSMIRSFTVIMLLALGIVLTTQVVFADEPVMATITYVVSEDALDGLEPMDPPDPVTGIAGRQVHHIPTLSSAVYTFLGWYSLDGETEVPHRKYDVINEDITLYGKWRLTPRVVRYDLDGGINHPDNPHIVYGNEAYTLEDPSKTGFVFDGWLLGGNPVTTLESVTTSIDLTATWSIASIDLTLDFANGDPDEVLTFAYGDPYDLTTYEPTRAGYDFDGWLDSGDQAFPETGTITIEADETVTAQWLARTDTEYEIITYKQNILDDDYTETTETLTGTTGETVTLTPEALTGFVYNDSLSTTSGEIQGDGSLTLHVYYDRETYDVSFYDVDDDLIETQSVRYQGDATEPVYAVPGYETSWTLSFTGVTETIDTYAVLTANTYEITFVSETSETFDPQSVTYDQAIGTLPTPNTIPEYKVFNGWKDVGGTPYDSLSIYDVVGDLVLYAEFIEATDVEYYVEYHFEDETGTFVHDPSEDRTLTGTAGDEVTAPALDVVPTGFVLQGSLPTGIITTDGLTLIVNYERITLTVTFSHYEEDVLVDTDVDVKYGLDVVAPTLDVRTGYTFNAWDKTLSDITEAQTITALYDLVTYTITYHYNDEDSFDDEAVHDSPVTTYTIESAEVVLTDPTRTTYTFDGWYDAETTGTLVTSIPAGSTGDVDLYAAWSVITYTVTFDNDPEIFEVEVEISATVPEEDFPTVTAPEGQALLYWYYGAEMEFTSDTIVGSDLTVYPLFADAVEITFLDHSGETLESDLVVVGMPIDAPELPSEDGYTYAWDQTVPDVASVDLTIQAVRTVNTYTISFDSQGGSAVDSLDFDFGQDTSAPTDPVRDGYVFDGWFEDAEATTPHVFGSMPAENLTLYAGWSESGGEEVVLYSTGFEDDEDFSAATQYNNTSVVYRGPQGQQWGFFYGTPSTTGPINGDQSAQMRWYSSAPDNLGYVFTDFDLSNIHRIDFLAESTSSIELTVSISTDGGSTWIAPEDFDLSESSNAYQVPSEYQDQDIRVRFEIRFDSTPSSSSRLLIDDVEFYSYLADVNIEDLVSAEIEIPEETETDLTLPASVTIGDDTYDIAWSSNDPAISDSGIVSRPEYADGDASVTMTATVSLDGAEQFSLDYVVLVLALPDQSAPETYVETFENHDLSGSSYQAGSYQGDEGITFSYVESRPDAGFQIDGKGIMLRDSGAYLEFTVEDGVGTLSFDFLKAFTGAGNRQLEVSVNGTVVGTSDAFDDTDVHSYEVEINESGTVTIRIAPTTAKQVVIDNLTWTPSSE